MSQKTNRLRALLDRATLRNEKGVRLRGGPFHGSLIANPDGRAFFQAVAYNPEDSIEDESEVIALYALTRHRWTGGRLVYPGEFLRMRPLGTWDPA